VVVCRSLVLYSISRAGGVKPLKAEGYTVRAHWKEVMRKG